MCLKILSCSSAQLPESIDPAVAVAAFQSQRDVLLVAICSCLTTLANKLLAKFVITQEIFDKACNPFHESRERAAYLLSCVQDRIKTEPADFVKVVDILESEPTLTRQARQLVDSYRKCSVMLIYMQIITNGHISGNPPPTPSAAPVSDAVSRISADLKAKYKCCPISSDKWPPTPSKEYIKLAVVQGHSACREDYIGRVLEGSISSVHGREKITEEQILDLCVEQVGKGRVIVIEGAPGIGKSTLAWELCRKWEEYASMEAYSLVILLRLREKRVQNISDVSSLFYAYSRADRTSLVEEITSGQGRGVLFVLDGFDELPKSLQREGVLVDLLQKSILPESTVVVTSRPSAMDRLLTISKPVIEKRIEILGFSQESIEAYASKVFARGELEAFKNYISAPQNPAINSLMYVPLYAAFVVIIYQSTTSKGSLPRTITQLYTQLCLTILNRYLEANTEYPSVRTIQDLPGALCGQFLELSKLAYEGFEKEEVILYGDIGEHFGFLDAVPDLYGGREISFNFLHLTLQEFFAAYHISRMSDSGVELFRTKGKDKRWNVVWRFVAGLTEFKYLDSSSIRAFLARSRNINIFFMQCLFEAQNVKLDFQSTFGDKTMPCRVSNYNTSLDCYALGYCIANCTTPESSWEVTLLDFIWDTTLLAFAHGLMTNKFSTGVITLLCASTPNIVELLYTCMNAVTTSPLCSITDLDISGDSLSSNKQRNHLFELISHMPHLQELYLSNYYFRNTPGSPYCACRDTDGLLKFLQYLPHSKVTSLDVRWTGLDYFLERSPLAQDYCAAIQALISPPSNLRELKIGPRYDSCHEGNLIMISLVSSPSSLRKLSLDLSSDCCLLNAFKVDNHLTELKIVYRNSVSVGGLGLNWLVLVPEVTRIIQHSTTLEILMLGEFDSQKDRDVLMDIATALQRNCTLNHLKIAFLHRRYGQLKEALTAVDSRISF